MILASKFCQKHWKSSRNFPLEACLLSLSGAVLLAILLSTSSRRERDTSLHQAWPRKLENSPKLLLLLLFQRSRLYRKSAVAGIPRSTYGLKRVYGSEEPVVCLTMKSSYCQLNVRWFNGQLFCTTEHPQRTIYAVTRRSAKKCGVRWLKTERKLLCSSPSRTWAQYAYQLTKYFNSFQKLSSASMKMSGTTNI